MGMTAFAFATKPAKNSVRPGFGDQGMQLRGGIPDGKDGAPLLRVIVLNAAITAGWFARMPIGAAIIGRGLGGQHRDLTIKTGALLLAFEVPPEVLRAGIYNASSGNREG